MSQNSHTLHLFFKDAKQLKLGQLAYMHLAAGNTEKAQQWVAKLGGADLEALWDSRWFNHEVVTAPTHLLLRFDTGPHDALPLRAFEELFAHGLKSAVLDVFYEQIGTTERTHYDQGRWVSRQEFLQTNPQWHAVVQPDGVDEEGLDQSKDPAQPIPISQLRQAEDQRRQESEAAVQALRELVKSDGPGIQGVIGALLVRAGLKGLLQAIAFSVITVLLFKGFWLWLGLGLVLAVALPLYYMMKTHKILNGDDDDDEIDDKEGAEDADAN